MTTEYTSHNGMMTAKVIHDGKNITKVLCAGVAVAVALSPVATANTTLIIDGTKSSPEWLKIISTFDGLPTGGTSPVPAGTLHVKYPESIWPFSGFDQPLLGSSVNVGEIATLAAINSIPGHINVQAISQGALVGHAVQNSLPAGHDITWNYYGDPINGHNGILHVFPINFEGYQDTGVKASAYPTNEVINQYDAVADFPDRPLNLIADANVLVGFALYGTHDYSKVMDTTKEPTNTVVTESGNTTTYFVPAKTLPLTHLLSDLGVDSRIVKAVDPILRKAVEAGYAPSVARGTTAPKHKVGNGKPAKAKHKSTK